MHERHQQALFVLCASACTASAVLRPICGIRSPQPVLLHLCYVSVPDVCAELHCWSSLQVLLQEHLPNGKVWHQYQDGLQDSRSDSSGASSSDLLEHVDKASGFTPLIAAIYYHKKAAVELVSCLRHAQAQPSTVPGHFRLWKTI